MISPLDFISYEHRPADFSSQGTELEGPPFGDYLARAEKERGGSSAQTETDRTEGDPPGSKVFENTEDSKKTETADDHAEGSKTRENDSPGDSERVQTDDSGDGSEETVPREKSETRKNIVSARADEKEPEKESQKSSTKADSAATILTLARKLVEGNDSGIKLQDGKKTETGKNTEKTAGTEKREDTAKPEEDARKTPGIKLVNVSGEGLVSGNAENAPIRGNRPAEQSGNGDESPRGSSALRRLPAGEETEKQTVRAEIIDLRSRKEARTEQAASQASQKAEGLSIQESLKPDVQGRQEFVVIEAGQGRTDGNISRGDTGPAQAAMDLSRALKEEGNGEIIKKAQFVLKEKDQGEIRLILKPEKLGEVRIRLNLSDNRHIAGRIIVENNSVREVFQENMEALNRAFRENGFQTAGLDVSVGEREGFSGRRREKQIEGLPAEKITRIFDDQVPRVEDLFFGESRVNVYV